jgi:adenylate cyclase
VSSALRAINAAQREFAQGALGKYLPRSVASEILRNPERLRLHGESGKSSACSATLKASPS